MAQHVLVSADRRVDRHPRADDRAGGVEVGALRQLPQPAVQALRPAAGQQHAAVALDPQRDAREHLQLVEALARRHPRQLVLAAGRAGDARGGERAAQAARRSRRAHRRAELHQPLVELAGIVAGGEPLHQRAGQRPDPLLAGGRLDVVLDAEHPRQHARDVAVDQRRPLAVRDRGDRAGGVGPDARHLAQPARVAGQRAAPARDHLAGPPVQVARARVVAQPGPRREHVVERRLREGADAREARHPALPVRDHRRDPRLLQHDLADPDRVGIAGAPPRQVAARAAVMLHDGGGDHGRGLRHRRRLADPAPLVVARGTPRRSGKRTGGRHRPPVARFRSNDQSS